MNILFISPSIPSKYHRIRAYHLIQALGKKHKVVVLSLVADPSQKLPQELESSCIHSEVVHKSKAQSLKDCLLSVFNKKPFEVAYCRSEEMSRRVNELCEKYKIECIYAKRLRSVQFTEGSSIPVIVDATDAMSLFYKKMVTQGVWYKKLFYIYEYLKYRDYEKKLAEKYKYWSICSPADVDYMKESIPTAEFFMIPNTVDEMPLQQKNTENKDTLEKKTIMLSGLMDKWVNIQAADYFVKKIFPGIQAVFPDVELVIVGPNPASAVRRLGLRRGVTVAGRVPDIQDVIVKSSVVVCPIKTGTGTRNKILQAWALGRPVVSTREGASGLMTKHGKNILIADEPQTFADHVVQLIKNKNLHNELGQGGYETVKKFYSPEVLERSLDVMLEKII